MVKKWRQQTAASKFQGALAAVEGSKTISRLSSEHEVHANLIRDTFKRGKYQGVVLPPPPVPGILKQDEDARELGGGGVVGDSGGAYRKTNA